MIDVVSRLPVQVAIRSIERLPSGLVPCNIAESESEKRQVVYVP